MKKSIVKWLLRYDVTWLPLLSMTIIGVVTYAIISIFGDEAGVFAPGLITAPLIAAYNLFLGAGIVNLILNLYHRGWYRKYYHTKEPRVNDQSVYDMFKSLPIWIKVLFIPLYGLLLLVLYVYILAQYV